jgi:lipopolysaccharide/colanic/teichoic acid biosynthesis glycosyltransferase
MKRTFDIFMAATGLVLFSPLLLLAALWIKADSHGPIFFRQERIGKGFRPFLIYKFRTMIESAPSKGSPITYGNDARITRAGRILRKTKLDELPQLVNVLKGEMTFVGPRPEVPQFVEMFRQDYEEILKVRPGITDLASLKYRNEAEILGRSADPRQEYISRVLPDKINLGKEYVRSSSLVFDVGLICKTVFKLIAAGRS